MARYFFDLVGPKGAQHDDVGGEFATLESAYFEAYGAALEISIEMLQHREDPNGRRFEVRDSERRLVIELPFAEVLHPGASVARPPDVDIHAALQTSIGRSRVLKAELVDGLAKAAASIEVARATLRLSTR